MNIAIPRPSVHGVPNWNHPKQGRAGMQDQSQQKSGPISIPMGAGLVSFKNQSPSAITSPTLMVSQQHGAKKLHQDNGGALWGIWTQRSLSTTLEWDARVVVSPQAPEKPGASEHQVKHECRGVSPRHFTPSPPNALSSSSPSSCG